MKYFSLFYAVLFCVIIMSCGNNRQSDNDYSSTENKSIKFISYSGEYPNLCRGQLIVEIDGQIVKFGHDTYNYVCSKDINVPASDGAFNSFWSSGGSCYFTNDYSEANVEDGDWIIDEKELPEKYRKYSVILDQLFNENVPSGCCGGCL